MLVLARKTAAKPAIRAPTPERSAAFELGRSRGLVLVGLAPRENIEPAAIGFGAVLRSFVGDPRLLETAARFSAEAS